mmetsp:Transcript_16792/g.42899  ORF Transcript_16792/g.42899 Transcript_16792/m.42899 type:complete len:115 (-) Transcript_16792:251-595(-)
MSRKPPRSLWWAMGAVKGLVVTVEMRDGSEFKGKLVDSDDQLNFHLQDVQHINPKWDAPKHFEEMIISGKNVRYVHLPEMIDMRTAVAIYDQKMKRLKNQYSRSIRVHQTKPKG